MKKELLAENLDMLSKTILLLMSLSAQEIELITGFAENKEKEMQISADEEGVMITLISADTFIRIEKNNECLQKFIPDEAKKHHKRTSYS